MRFVRRCRNALPEQERTPEAVLREVERQARQVIATIEEPETITPRAYARCLTKVIETMPGPGLAAVPHVSSSTHSATTRIECLLDRHRPSGRLALMPALAGSLTLAALAVCTVHALPIATDNSGQPSLLPFSASLASAGGTNTGVKAGGVSSGGAMRAWSWAVASGRGSPISVVVGCSWIASLLRRGAMLSGSRTSFPA